VTHPSHADGNPGGIAPEDLPHLRRCVELAAEAVDAGDHPFGSVLVAAGGPVLAEDRNRENTMETLRGIRSSSWPAGPRPT